MSRCWMNADSQLGCVDISLSVVDEATHNEPWRASSYPQGRRLTTSVPAVSETCVRCPSHSYDFATMDNRFVGGGTYAAKDADTGGRRSPGDTPVGNRSRRLRLGHRLSHHDALAQDRDQRRGAYRDRGECRKGRV